MVTLNVITPIIRYSNIKRIYRSMRGLDGLSVRWLVVGDEPYDVAGRIVTKDPGVQIVYGWIKPPDVPCPQCAKRNYALDHMTKPGWVYNLDDDNIIHPLFPSRLMAFAAGGWRGIVFGQDRPNRIALPEPGLTRIDTGQFAVHTDLIGGTRWELHPNADGHFVREIYEKNKGEFGIVYEVATFHNKLRRGEV